jgi:hypothetical protein
MKNVKKVIITVETENGNFIQKFINIDDYNIIQANYDEFVNVNISFRGKQIIDYPEPKETVGDKANNDFDMVKSTNDMLNNIAGGNNG